MRNLLACMHDVYTQYTVCFPTFWIGQLCDNNYKIICCDQYISQRNGESISGRFTHQAHPLVQFTH